MVSISQMQEILSTTLGSRADDLARETGCVRRQRKLSGQALLHILVFGWLAMPSARVEELAQVAAQRDVPVSASAIQQRFTPQAAAFLQAVLAELVQQTVAVEAVAIPLLQRFGAVVLEDSTQISLPDELREVWRGCGGGGAQSEAGLKLHVRWDLLHGTLWGPMLSDGRQADQRSPLREQPLEADTLYITDEGYFGLQWLHEHAQRGNWFLTRPRSNTAFFDQAGQRLDLSAIGPKAVHQCLDVPVEVGGQVRLPARLLMVRVPDEVIAQRRAHLRETAQRHSTEPTPLQLALAQWTILITNVPPERLQVAEVLVLQRARWQIELLFKLWKEGGQIDEWRTSQPMRILCEIYAKLIAMVLQHWLLLHSCWHDPQRSLVKAAKLVRRCALDFLQVLMGEGSLSQLLQRLQHAMRVGCRLNRRRQHPSLPQLFLEGLPWPLT